MGATERITVIVTERGSRLVRQRVLGIGGAAAGAANSVNFLRNSLLALGSVATLRTAIRTIADFAQAMASVRAISQATDSQMVQLRETARTLGATTRFTATQAAEGLVFLARAGFSVDEQLQTIEGTLRLAQAGNLELGRSADIATNVLRGFRLEASQTGAVVDVLARAANSANTTVQQLGDGLKFVAPVASGVGVSLEETVAAMGALSDAGLQAQLAGTGLRRVLSELESPSTKTIQIFRSLGLEARDVRVSQVGLTESVRRLAEAGLDTGLALEVFQDRGGPAFEVLAASLPSIERLNGLLDEAGGTAERISQIMDQNLLGALKAVQSASEAVVLSLGDLGVESILENAVRQLAQALRFLAANAEILAGALGGLALVVLPRLITLLRFLFLVVAGSPVGLLVVGLGAALGATLAFSDSIVTLQDYLKALKEFVSTAIGPALQSFAESIGGWPGEFSLTFEEVLINAGAFIDNFVAAFEGGFMAVGVLLEEVGKQWPVLLKAAAKLMANAIISAFEFMVQSVAALLEGFRRAQQQFLSRLQFAWQLWGQAVNAAFDGNYDLAVERLKDATFQLENATFAVGRNVSAAFKDMRSLTLLDRWEITPEEQAALDGLGRDLLAAFLNPFEREGPGATEQAVRDIIARAQQIAEERRKALGDDPPGSPGSPGTLDDPGRADRRRANTIAAFLRELEEEQALLSVSNREREIRQRLLEIEQELAGRNIDLTREELDLFRETIEQTEFLKEKRDLIDSITEPLEANARAQRALNEALEEGSITLEQFLVKQRELQLEALETDRTVFGGFERGFLRLEELISDFGSAAETAVVNAFTSMEDALVDFVTTGEINFSQMVDSMLADITRLLARQAIFGLLASAGAGPGFGATGGIGGFLFGGARAEGGPVNPGRSYLVGEEGPELFTPRTAGMISPNGATGASPVSVTVVNVVDPGMVNEALNSPDGHQAVLNVIGNNRQRAKQQLGL